MAELSGWQRFSGNAPVEFMHANLEEMERPAFQKEEATFG
jgi:hypothetical protein